MADDDRLVFHQLLAGRDIAGNDLLARQMVNFVYVIGDRQSGEAMVVDPAYDIPGILDIVNGAGLRLTGALVTHHHQDHIGGNMFGYAVQGVDDLLEQVSIPVHVQATEAELVRKVSDLTEADLVVHDSGDVVMIGEVPIELIHTPGHTPGSQCFFVDNHLVAGDTLFLEGCGRTDLPGGDPDALYDSIRDKLARIPDDATLYPGHLYSPEPHASMGETRRLNFVFKPESKEQWLMIFGQA